CTWGFHACYNPWLGRWSFGYSYWSGFLRVGYRWHRGTPGPLAYSPPRWFGPGGYRRPLYGPDRAPIRVRRGGRVAGPADAAPMNLYKRPENIVRVNREASRMPLRPIARPPATARQKPNNVFAGRDGKVYQRDESGKWKVNEGRNWQPTQLPQPKSEKPASPGGTITNPRPGSDWPRARPLPEPARPAEPRNEPRPAPPTTPPPGPTPSKTPPPASHPPTPSVQPERPTFRPAPPQIKPVPGDLNREFHGRERGSAPPVPARPAPAPEKKKEPEKHKPPPKS